ncbi:hypothetical protein DFP72DRAFT_844575 [Ephemerocybe angulata]|uniref:DUF6533 domain-containing protein n=1 Tax=Ephemerocybe angulata TaxID=980116 RepID=A0A8H6I7I0_9AGAR|nr:hypothetical protein DFP72DRAFT_844575 [Tulosesus angulatus]
MDFIGCGCAYEETSIQQQQLRALENALLKLGEFYRDQDRDPSCRRWGKPRPPNSVRRRSHLGISVAVACVQSGRWLKLVYLEHMLPEAGLLTRRIQAPAPHVSVRCDLAFRLSGGQSSTGLFATKWRSLVRRSQGDQYRKWLQPRGCIKRRALHCMRGRRPDFEPESAGTIPSDIRSLRRRSMDEPEIDLATMIDTVQTQYIRNYVLMVALSGLLWYYITTFGDEVDRISPQPALKPGRMLFLILRYITIVGVALEFVANYPAGWWVIVSLGNVFAEAIFWICLSALFGEKKWAIYLLVFGFMSRSSFELWLANHGSAKYFGQHVLDMRPQKMPLSCIPLQHISDLREQRGYQVISIVAFVTFSTRYRRHKSSLLSIVKREGAMYYFSVGILQLFIGLRYSASSGIKDKYGVVTAIRRFLIPIFADRLLLGLRALRYTELRYSASSGSKDKYGVVTAYGH